MRIDKDAAMGKVQVRTTWDYSLAMDETTIAGFEASLRGMLIQRGDAAYESARRVYNGMIDKHPCMVARCANVADVITVVNFARKHGLLLAVRGGGHNGGGLGTCDDGVVLDLSQLKGVRVDPDNRTVRAEGGCTQGDVDHVASAFGLAVPAGVVSTTGIGGLTLGGGHGYLTRKHGLTIDNLLEADVVLADARLVTASADKNADLFWAIRGGGGNFGVVTSFLFQAHPVGMVTAGPMFWDVNQTGEMLRWYREFLPAASDDLYGFFAFMNTLPVPIYPSHLQGKPVCGVIWCHLGTPEQAQRDLDVVRRSHPPLFEQIARVPFVALQCMFDPLVPPGLQWYWRGDFLTDLPEEAIELHAEFGARVPTLLSRDRKSVV
jgi:hypothetical protein